MEMLWPEYREAADLSPDEAQVIAVPLDPRRPIADELVSTLSAEERRRAERFQLEAPRRQFVAGRVAVRMLLREMLDIPPAEVAVAFDAHGKPRVRAGKHSTSLQFNLAHSGDMVLVAIASGCAIGVDVERLRQVSHLEQIARRYFHPGEVQEILAAPASERDALFLRCWTGKEAVVKAVGSGLSESLSRFRVPVKDDCGAWVEMPAVDADRPAHCWLQSLAPSINYLSAVACVGEPRRVTCFTLRL